MTTARKSKRRTAVAVIGMFAIMAVFAVKLVDIQVVHAEELNEASLNKRSIAVTTYGVRGNIVDTNGTVLADSVERYDITASPIIALANDSFKRTVTAATATEKAVKEEVTFEKAITELAEATGEDEATIRESLLKKPDSDFAPRVR